MAAQQSSRRIYHLCMALVEVDAVSKSYARRLGLRTEQQTVVADLSLKIESGETLGLVGESGSGKTTLARMILGLVEPTSGAIRVDGRDVNRVSRAELRRLRRQMQPVFQDPYAALNPRMNVLQIVSEPWAIHGINCGAADSTMPTAGENEAPCPCHPERSAAKSGVPRDRSSSLGWESKDLRFGFWRKSGRKRSLRLLRARATELLAQVGLDESALDRYPHEFSGGQRQRINIARALALRPRLLILDEPVSALDVSVGAQIVNLLRSLQREYGLTYLFITHSMPLARYLSTRIAVMERGRLVESGEAVALCEHPRQAYTQQLIAATPELPACDLATG
jgi:peptide/nickel transport system ATP-binding protein